MVKAISDVGLIVTVFVLRVISSLHLLARWQRYHWWYVVAECRSLSASPTSAPDSMRDQIRIEEVAQLSHT